MEQDDQKAEQATQAARKMIASVQGGGYKDLADFYVMEYTNEELKDLGEEPGDWVAQYVKGSVDSPRGTTVLVNTSKHSTVNEMVDTILHEVGHALWELLDQVSQQAWIKALQGLLSHRWGPEEQFADDFMYLCTGQTQFMQNEELFIQLTQSGS